MNVESEASNLCLLAVAELAALLNVCERTVWRLHDAGKLPAAVRIGRLVRWRKDEIEAWIKSGCKKAVRKGKGAA